MIYTSYGTELLVTKFQRYYSLVLVWHFMDMGYFKMIYCTVWRPFELLGNSVTLEATVLFERSLHRHSFTLHFSVFLLFLSCFWWRPLKKMSLSNFWPLFIVVKNCVWFIIILYLAGLWSVEWVVLRWGAEWLHRRALSHHCTSK